MSLDGVRLAQGFELIGNSDDSYQEPSQETDLPYGVHEVTSLDSAGISHSRSVNREIENRILRLKEGKPLLPSEVRALAQEASELGYLNPDSVLSYVIQQNSPRKGGLTPS